MREPIDWAGSFRDGWEIMTLQSDLIDVVTGDLLRLQDDSLPNGETYDNAVSHTLSLIQPYANLFGTRAAKMLNRLDRVNKLVAADKKTGSVYAWVIPAFAAQYFELIFQTCFAYWLANGKPSTVTALKQNVADFVNQQVQIFNDGIGGTKDPI